MKLLKVLSFTTIFYLIIFVLDWIATLFTIGDSNNTVESFLGVELTQIIGDDTLKLNTSILPKAFIYYIIFTVVVIICYFVYKSIKTRSRK